ncbi:hypothetical protein [Dactylosporangium sp. NPDC049140]|uniref:hypothetical protein n=1 Tax=Dactylosporangium sp. NPDC049140 TaxID=3155647 RepID=UPI0033EE03EE
MQPTRYDREREANELAGMATQAHAAGRLDEALAHADGAVAAAEAIVSAHPADAQARWMLAGQLYNRAGVHNTLGDHVAAGGDAQRSFEIYQRLAALAPPCIPQRADAQARLARALAFAATRPGVSAVSAREHAEAAVQTYRELVAYDAAQRPGLARVYYLQGEVHRALDGEGTPGSIAAYAAAAAEYRALGPVSPADRLSFADAVMRLAYGYAEAEALDEARDAATEAVDQYALVARETGLHENYPRALSLLGMVQRMLGDPEAEQSLVDARYLITRLHEPLAPDLAEIRDWLDPAATRRRPSERDPS